jgi:UDP-2,3-diacylglucosamine pyrophosphatase LpxH
MRVKYLIPILVLVLIFGFGSACSDISRSTEQEDKVQVESRLEALENPVKETKEENVKQNKDLEIREEIIFSFAVFGDNRPKDDYSPQPEEFLRILKLIKDYNPDFAFSTGDIIYGGTADKEVIERKFLDFLDAISILNCKLYIAPGNHDVNNKISREYFQDFINSDEKSYYYFEYKDVYFIVLDTYEEKQGQIIGSQLLWLEDLLKILKEKKVFVFLHPPIYSILNPECITDGSLHIAFSDKENQNYLRYLFNEFKVDGVFSGHEHLFNRQKILNTTYIITGGSGANLHVSKYRGGFYHFLIIEIKNNNWICKVIDIDGKLIEKASITFN